MTAEWVERAQRGNEEAIAHLFNRVLHPHHLQVTATVRDGNLSLVVQGKPAPPPPNLLPLLYRGLLKLRLAHIRTVSVVVQDAEGEAAVWTAEIPGNRRGVLKGLAEYGDDGAIAHLLTQALTHKHVTVQAQHEDDHLTLRLIADPLPDTFTLVTLLKREMASWNTQLFQTIEVQGYATGAKEPQWVETLNPKISTPAVVPAGSRSPQKSMSSKPAPAVWTFKFETPKLVLIGFLLAYGLFGAQHYNFSDFINGANPLMMFIHNVNLIFHEAGHTIFSMFGLFIKLLAGSGMQIAVPAVICGYFALTRQPFAAAVALCWVGENFWDVSIYIKDAQEKALPLLGGEAVLHDWHMILMMLRKLQYDDAIGNATFAIGSAIYAFAIFVGVFYAQIQPRTLERSETQS
jgi:hypothetical protein